MCSRDDSRHTSGSFVARGCGCLCEALSFPAGPHFFSLLRDELASGVTESEWVCPYSPLAGGERWNAGTLFLAAAWKGLAWKGFPCPCRLMVLGLGDLGTDTFRVSTSHLHMWWMSEFARPLSERPPLCLSSSKLSIP